MKEYKVGDTIYVQGIVGRTDDTRNPCYVEFGYGVEGWIPRDNIIDELPTAEPVKPVLPKDVADEMEVFRKSNKLGVYLNLALTNTETIAYRWTNNDRNIVSLVNAWYNGYTVETEKKYNLILGTGTDGDTNVLFKSNPCAEAVLLLDTDTYADDLKRDKFYQFTQEEIDKFNKDFWIKNIDLNDYKVEVTDDDQ